MKRRNLHLLFSVFDLLCISKGCLFSLFFSIIKDEPMHQFYISVAIATEIFILSANQMISLLFSIVFFFSLVS